MNMYVPEEAEDAIMGVWWTKALLYAHHTTFNILILFYTI